VAGIASVRRSLNQSSAPTPSSYLESRRAALADPWEVVLDPDLTGSEKKDILSAWASAARAIDGRPDRHGGGAAGTTAWWHDLTEGLRLVEAEIATSPRPRPGHLRPLPRTRSARAG